MELSLFLAKFLGIYCTIICAGILLNKEEFKKMVNRILKNDLIIYVTGVFTLFLFLPIVLMHQVWTADWRLLITLVGWIGFFKGLIRVLCPNFAIQLIKKVREPKIYWFTVSVFLIIGLYLTYIGFFISPK